MKKRIIKISLIAVFLLILIGLFSIVAKERRSNREQFFSTYSLSDEEVELLQDGDIILRKGYGIVSKNIAEYLDEEYIVSHCGIIVKSNKGNYFVIHSVSGRLSEDDGLQICSLKTFCKESIPNSILVTRLKEDNRTLISKDAKRYLKAKIPFDNSFSLEDQSEIYCSELVWKILLDNYDLNIYSVDKRPDNIQFAPLYNPQWFDVVINHQSKDQ